MHWQQVQREWFNLPSTLSLAIQGTASVDLGCISVQFIAPWTFRAPLSVDLGCISMQFTAHICTIHGNESFSESMSCSSGAHPGYVQKMS